MLEAQRTKLAEQQSAVLEQAPAPADAPDVPEAPVTPEAPETQPEPVDADADPETDEYTPMRSYLRLIQYSEMLQPKVIVVEQHETRIVGGIAVSVPTSSAEPEPPPPPSAAEPGTAKRAKKKHGDGEADNGKRNPRRCMRCVQFNKADTLPCCRSARARRRPASASTGRKRARRSRNDDF